MNTRDVDDILPGFAAHNFLVLSKSGGYTPLVLNPIQADRWRAQLATQKTRFVDLKARQVGMTTLHHAKNLLRAHFIDGYTIAVIAQGDDSAELQRKTVLDILDRLPRDAGLPRLKSRSAPLIWENGSRMIFSSAESRQQLGRGVTVHSLHCTEYAKWADPASTLAALMPAVPLDGEIVIESTPLGFGDFRDKCLDAKENPHSPWHFSFYQWFRNPEYQLPVPPDFQPTPEEAALMAAHNLSAGQMMFRRLQQHDHPTDYLSEYAEDFDTCFLATGDSKFPASSILAVSQACRPPLEVRHDGLLKLWQPPYPETAYAIGVDTAEGVAHGDYAAAVVLRAGSNQVVATLSCDPPHPASRERRLDPDTFARELAHLGREYNDALICVEGMGRTAGAVLHALESTHQYPNLFREDTGNIDNPHGKSAGLRMIPQTKSLLVNQFARAVAHQDFIPADIRLAQQMADFIVAERTPNGYEKLEARAGAHDDLLIAHMLALHAAPAAATHGRRRLFARIW